MSSLKTGESNIVSYSVSIKSFRFKTWYAQFQEIANQSYKLKFFTEANTWLKQIN